MDFDDELFDVDAVVAGAWIPGPYGPDDRLGSYNEVTGETRAAAMAMLDLTRPVDTYSLGVEVFEGFPAFGDRPYRQQLLVAGYEPPDDYEGLLRGTEPLGPNRLSYHEERVEATYNLASKINGFLHCGVDGVFYNGVKGRDVARTGGAADLDNLSWGAPLLTRGYLIDVAASKAGGPETFEAANGATVLNDGYRITVEDLEEAIERQGLPDFEPGDAILLRTGWNNLVRSDPERFLADSPGVWLRETRWLAASRPAIVGVDSWVWGTMDAAIVNGNWSACHQELLYHHGIRLGEGIGVEALAAAGVDRFVFCHAPFPGEGATSASSPAMAIANRPNPA